MSKAPRACLLTNFIPPYFLPVLQHLAAGVMSLDVLVSTPMEPDRAWQTNWDGIKVTVQKSFSFSHRHVFEQGYGMKFLHHFPYDTLPLLFRIKPEVIISAGMGFRTMQAAAYRRSNPDCRLIIWADLSEHTEREIGQARRFVRRILLHSSDAVLAIGSSGGRYIESLSVPRDRIVVSPYGSDSSQFAPRHTPSKSEFTRRLVYVGHLEESKGLSDFVRALARWAEKHPDQKVELSLAGDGALRKTLAQHPVPQNIRLSLHGNVPFDELPNCYTQADIFVFPTFSDTWGMVVNEAMAAGLPVLGSCYSQAVQELVRDGENGWTFRPDRPGDIDNALSQAMSVPLCELRRMGCTARKSVFELTPEYVAGRYLQAIEVALDRGGCDREEQTDAARRVTVSENGAGNPRQVCPLCGGAVASRLRLRHTTVWECASATCRLQFAHPQPTDEGLATAYTSLYYPSQAAPEQPRFQNTPESILRDLFRQLERRVGTLRGLRLLDYGCGRGALLRIAMEFGMRTCGIEPDPEARAIASSIPDTSVYSSLLDLRQAGADARFDVVILWTVIEHLRTPWADLSQLRTLLEPRGLLLISTMNIRCLRAWVEGPRWENYENPTHLYYFDRVSLARAIREAGFARASEWKLKFRYPQHGILRRWLYELCFSIGRSDGLFYLCEAPTGNGEQNGTACTPERTENGISNCVAGVAVKRT